MIRTQQQFASFFASLIITPTPIAQGAPDSDDGRPVPAYNISVLTNYGSLVGVQTRPRYPMEQPI